ncbi:2-polyprenyl-6-methoxyphenol hydroxylase-like oxidoreductase [Cylindrospermum stagnale PCC 7417]|uniref:2-polyprenyl-6-methoxyphenol hydroxylase-like oxidoreductase n=1 Tax=Cylindrospermum stagnale PCC 7417 TaxID=56107 RepID=K9X7Z5_9NOST|nr:FAD-dependent monooxygenase [Cylindrospermum stagnale]AFZ27787.1 2-polyprenyl-6-methoxyphenol hydroxylase-like oxidoreductase [Cylindrospermum stagnale PCC 7417]
MLNFNQGIYTEKKALVIGGSIAGLLAAQVLTKHFDHVTIVERDRLFQEPEQRQGLPQAHHLHVLLLRGKQILEQLFPGIEAELAESGAPAMDWTADGAWLGLSGWAPRFRSDLITHTCSRNLLERTIRRRLAANKRVAFVEGGQVTSLLSNEDKTKMTGVCVRVDKEVVTEIFADLVVDASGRNSRSPQWLQAMGYEPPQETIINSFLGYASRCYELAAEKQVDWNSVYVTVQAPGTRGSAMSKIEGNRWMVILMGVARDYPPTNEAEFLNFARSLRSPIIYETIKDAKPLSPVYAYKRTENCLRHYEKLSRLPEGLAVLGDAVCAFNPVYGQGMTTAALGALTLDECLSKQRFQHPDGNLIGLSRHFQKQLHKVITVPWLITTCEDFRWSTTEGGKPSLMTKIMQRYLKQVLVLQATSPQIHQVFLEVMHMIKPPSALFHPSILMQVVKQVFKFQRPERDFSNRQGFPNPLSVAE